MCGDLGGDGLGRKGHGLAMIKRVGSKGSLKADGFNGVKTLFGVAATVHFIFRLL